MSKTLSFRGKLDPGLQEKINLKTLKGKVGYKITKFEVFPTNPGNGTAELVLQCFSTDQTGNITATVDFSDSDLLAVAFCNNASDKFSLANLFTIFDTEVFNQNIFVNLFTAVFSCFISLAALAATVVGGFFGVFGGVLGGFFGVLGGVLGGFLYDLLIVSICFFTLILVFLSNLLSFNNFLFLLRV